MSGRKNQHAEPYQGKRAVKGFGNTKYTANSYGKDPFPPKGLGESLKIINSAEANLLIVFKRSYVIFFAHSFPDNRILVPLTSLINFNSTSANSPLITKKQLEHAEVTSGDLQSKYYPD